MPQLDGLAVLQASELPSIHKVFPVSSKDQVCIDEIKQVLARHGAQSRSGIALLHKHFELTDDEILVEECDVEQRVLTTRPRKLSEVTPQRFIKTVFAFDPSLERDCQPHCPYDDAGNHHGYKEPC